MLRQSPMVRLFLIDDHEIVRAAVRMLVERVDEFVVVGEARDGASAVESIARTPTDVVVTDLILGHSEQDGVRTIEEIRRVAPSSRVLVLSMHDQAEHVERAMAAGAHGYTAKVDEWRELVIAVRTLAAGGTYLSRAVADWQQEQGGDRLAGLPPRQIEILRLVAEGYGRDEIADMLGVARWTVDTHCESLMARLGRRDVAGLTRFAVEAGLVDRPPATTD